MFHRLLFSSLSISLSLFIIACSGEVEEQTQMGPIPVSTFNVEKSDISLSFEYPTKLTSIQSVDIYARVEGILLEQKFIEGAMIEKGDKLFKIDPAIYQANVNSAKAQLSSAHASFNQANKTWNRAKNLFEQNALSPRERDEALANFESAQASVQNAKAALDTAMINLEYTDVIAPLSGKIGMKNYDIGDLVGNTGGNNILTTITQLNPIHAEFSIPSNDYFFIRTLNRDNISISYILQDGTPYANKGKLDFIDSVISENTSTVKARAIVENDDYLLVPGEFSRIRLDGFILKDSIAIPQIALMQDANGSFVYRVVDGKATLTPVVLGYTFGKNVVIKSGLLTGDIVVTSQLIKLRPEVPVTSINQTHSTK